MVWVEIKFSIIIPVYNSQDSLAECLKSVFNSNYNGYEVIVVDDCSTDSSVEIAKKLGCKVIKHKKNGGAAKSRNTGAKSAKGSILIFLDSDVIIRKSTLKMFDESFRANQNAAAIQSIYSKYTRYQIFTNVYKMLYLRYGFEKIKEKSIPTIASYCVAIKRNIFEELKGYNDKIPSATTEDDEFGHRITNNNYKIILNKNIECDHIVKMGFIKTLKRDYYMAKAVAKSVLRNENQEMKNTLKEGKFATNVGLNIMLSPLAAVLLIGSIITIILTSHYWAYFSVVFFLLAFTLLNFNFFRYICKEKGLIFSLKSWMFSVLDMSVIAAAGFIGCLEYLFLGAKY